MPGGPAPGERDQRGPHGTLSQTIRCHESASVSAPAKHRAQRGGERRDGAPGARSDHRAPRSTAKCALTVKTRASGACELDSGAEGPGELRTAADVKLAVDVAEVPLDALDGDEQRVGDLPVALAGGRELGHAVLAGGEPSAGDGGRGSSP